MASLLVGDSPRPQEEALDLARLRLRELVEELDLARILMAPDAALDHIHDLVRQSRRRRVAGLEHHEGLDDVPAERIRLADDGGLRHRRVAEDRALDLEGTDPIAGALDHVVRPSLEPEVAIGVPPPEVADGHPAVAIETPRPPLVSPVAERVVALGVRAHADLTDDLGGRLSAIVVHDR